MYSKNTQCIINLSKNARSKSNAVKNHSGVKPAEWRKPAQHLLHRKRHFEKTSLWDNTPCPFLHTDHFTGPDKTSTTQQPHNPHLHGLALCHGNILVTMIRSGCWQDIHSARVPLRRKAADGPNHHWHTLDVGDEYTSLTRMVAAHRSTTHSPQQRLHLFLRPSVNTDGCKAVLVGYTHLSCYRRGAETTTQLPIHVLPRQTCCFSLKQVWTCRTWTHRVERDWIQLMYNPHASSRTAD